MSELLSSRPPHEEDGSGAISDLRGVSPGGFVSPLGEGGADLLERFKSGPSADPVILGDGDFMPLPSLGVLDLGLDGDNLVLEPAGLLGGFGALVGLCGPLVLELTSDVEVFANVLWKIPLAPMCLKLAFSLNYNLPEVCPIGCKQSLAS